MEIFYIMFNFSNTSRGGEKKQQKEHWMSLVFLCWVFSLFMHKARNEVNTPTKKAEIEMCRSKVKGFLNMQ